MSIDDLRSEAIHMTKWQRHRFLLLIAAVIIISCVLVSISLSLYNSSGAAQVDLSRPGYQSVRSEASRDSTPEDAFPSTGDLDDAAFKQFDTAYDKHAKRVTGVDSFDPEALSDDSLQLYQDSSAPAAAQ